MDYLQKYQKYKAKYNNLKLQNQYGGKFYVFKIFFLTYTEYNEYIFKKVNLSKYGEDLYDETSTDKLEKKTPYFIQNTNTLYYININIKLEE